MFNWIDNLLNKVTMYRLVVYFLCLLLLQAFILAFFHLLSFGPWDLLFSTGILIVVSWLVNDAIAAMLKIPSNVDSFLITALILALIITPPGVHAANYWWGVGFLIWASVFAMASKFILTWKAKHIFNPAALAVALTAFTISSSASWWVGTVSMLPLVIIGGLLVVRKIQRFDMVLTFFVFALASIFFTSPSRSDIWSLLTKILLDTPIFFFAFIMLTEPLTTPSTRPWRMTYGALVGLLFAPNVHALSVYSTPELSLLVANVFSYILEPKGNFLLVFKHKAKLGKDTYEFIFEPKNRVPFTAGQYLEFTLPHPSSDSRGSRRYFTIASSPDEHEIRLGIKFYNQPSTFKKALLGMHPGTRVLGGHPVGDFTLPRDKNRKLTFIAGGIGITPFHSMLQHLLDQGEKRDIVMFYSNKTANEIVYHETIIKAQDELGIKTYFTLTDTDQLPENWPGLTGFLTPRTIQKILPDFHHRTYYVSGPRSMVVAFEKTLKQAGVHRTQIRVDFFPGFA